MGHFIEELRERLSQANERLTNVEASYQRMRADFERRYRLEQSEALAERNALQTLLDLEERRQFDKPLPRLEPPSMELGEFFLMQLQVHSPMSKDELRGAAERAGYFMDGESGGRRTHTTLMNYARSRRVRELPDGRYARATELNTLLTEPVPALVRSPGETGAEGEQRSENLNGQFELPGPSIQTSSTGEEQVKTVNSSRAGR